MEAWVQSFLDLIAHHEHWAGVLVFLTAMTEAIAVVGLFIPGTTILLGVGAVAGLGHIAILPLILWAVAGAVVGDGLSYWIGHRYKDRIRTSWPFKQRPELLEKGEAFFAKHGAMGVFIGRFVPAFRAIVPMVAGLLGMAPVTFYTANVLSALIWAPTHILAGTVVGLGLDLLGAFAGRIVILLAVLLLAIGLLVWLLRLGFRWLGPVVAGWQRSAVAALRQDGSRPSRALAALLDPDDPGTSALLALSAVLVLLVLVWVWLTADTMLHARLGRIDRTIDTLMLSLRMPALDRVMAVLTGFGDGVVILLVTLAAVAWLAWRRSWRLAIGLPIVVGFAAIVLAIVGWRTSAIGEDSWLPSGHALFAATLFGSVAWILFANGRGWTQAAGAALTAIVILPIVASRLYLGLDSVSDIAEGLLVGTALAAIYGVVFRHTRRRPVHPEMLGIIVVVVLAGLGSWHAMHGADAVLAASAKPAARQTMAIADWQQSGWISFAARRIELDGSEAEPLSLQYAGDPARLGDVLIAAGWQKMAAPSSANFANYASAATTLDVLPGLMLTQSGHLPALAMAQAIDGRDRLVLRLWPTNHDVSANGQSLPLYLGSITREALSRPLHLVSTVRDLGAGGETVDRLAEALAKQSSVIMVRAKDGDRTVLLLRAASTP